VPHPLDGQQTAQHLVRRQCPPLFRQKLGVANDQAHRVLQIVRHGMGIRIQIGNQSFTLLFRRALLSHVMHHHHRRVGAGLITIKHGMRVELQVAVKHRIMLSLIQRFTLNHLWHHFLGQLSQIAGGLLAGRMQQLVPVLAPHRLDAAQPPLFDNPIGADDFAGLIDQADQIGQ